MELTATVQTVIFRNSENGWTVLEVLPDEGEKTSVVGVLPLANVGERITFTGAFTTHPRYGFQFKAISMQTLAPATQSAVEAWLGSGLIRGIGASTAHAIVSKFGMETLSVFDNEPERLIEVPGIGKKKLGMILDSYRENRSQRDILLSLEPYGVTVSQALKLYQIYGELALAHIEENPYQLIHDVDGIGFLTADKIAQNVAGYEPDSYARIKAGLSYTLSNAANEFGHTYLPKDRLIPYAAKLLGVSEEAVSDSLDSLQGDGETVTRMVGETEGVFLPRYLTQESSIAERLIRLSEKPIENPFFDFNAAQAQRNLVLSPQQRFAVEAALSEGTLVITGGPGTGKTTIIRFITELMQEMGLEVALTAPTGRAAKRMTEATDHDAKTLHRLLEYIPGEGFQRNADNPLFYDMIIVDEMSMVDVPLMHAFLRAVPEGTRLILVGDADQLPSVGAGEVLRDIIESSTVPVIRLTEIFRQAGESRIVTNAHRINEGNMPVLDGRASDFRFEEILSQEQVLNRILSLVSHPGDDLITGDPLTDVQVLAPMKKGVLGVFNLNARLQGVLNPPAHDKREHPFGETNFREGDRVMQIKNDYKVSWIRQIGTGVRTEEGTGAFNGDLGTLYCIDEMNRRFEILFDDNRLAGYDFTQFEEIDLAYCISIHKSQGSEFPIVILPMAGGASPMLTRNLLYTAVTRAKKQAYLIGSRDAVSFMIRNNRTNRRYTSLAAQLVEWRGLLS